MAKFTHLHVHTQYSILDGASKIPDLVSKAKDSGMEALAITDHGNMFGVKKFFDTCKKSEIKPIIGCEAYIAANGIESKVSREDRSGHHLVLLAKNKTGYHNLMKLVSKSWIDGYYYRPRMDKEMLRENSEGIIASSACLAGEVSRAINRHSKEKAIEVINEYKEIFGDDFYLEIMDHSTPHHDHHNEELQEMFRLQKNVIDTMIELGEETQTKVLATNDVHFINREDAPAHDILICLSTGKDVDDPSRMRYSGNEYLRTPEEMEKLFSFYPQALENTQEVFQKIEEYDINSDPIMPDFPLPEGFENEADYLRHLTNEGAKMRYGNVDKETQERIDFELDTVIKMGFPGYFLIVWDFIRAAREMGVSVGPGRGSAAGAVMAYCLRITDIDPIKYQLLFERFLNPDRVSMPDIDIDFDEDGRDKVLKWVVDKYGYKRVSHIITFGSMAAKSSIRDVARVLKLPLPESNRLAKLVPANPGMNLMKAYKEEPELLQERESGEELVVDTLANAEKLEGSIRQTGVHACGIIIAKDDLENYVPVSTAKGADLLVTQYEGKFVEDVGMLKMDFLGLRTLSIIMDAVKNIKLSQGVDVDIDSIPLTDEKTFELFSNGETTGIFQFESAGMKKYLKELKPNRFEDLIAMNALYRPGPLEYIPSFVRRKHGQEEIKYDLPEMEEHLKDTYGITVYQEQVMLLSQKLAGFSKGDADGLRKAMGKKIKAMMDKLKIKFEAGCEKNGHNPDTVQKIWKDWEAFAQYAFNKSHSTCYAYVAYQTAYLKAHYPAEFMAAVLSRNLSDIEKVTIFMDECKRMKLNVFGPDVNESINRFSVDSKGNVRFGLAGVKGVGGKAVDSMVEERDKNGNFTDVFDFIERIDQTSMNKKNIEALCLSGALDSFGIKREQYYEDSGNGTTYIETLIKYGNAFKADKASTQASLFGDTLSASIEKPKAPNAESWSDLVRLNKEKELVGIYLSAHPLDEFRLEIEHLCNNKLSDLEDLESQKGKDITVAGMVTNVRRGTTKTGNPFAIMTLSGYSGSHEFAFFGKDYTKFAAFFEPNCFLMISGKVQNRWGGDQLEFKVADISFLSELKDSGFKSLSLTINHTDINEMIVDQLQNLLKDNPGKATLKFSIIDREEGISLKMFSRTEKVAVNNNIIDFLEEYPAIKYKIG